MEPVAKSEMLIRRPVAEVFEAFISPLVKGFKLATSPERAKFISALQASAFL